VECLRRVLYRPSVQVNVALWVWARVGQDCRSSSSVLMVAKNDSATALTVPALTATPDRQAHAELVGQPGVLGAGVLPRSLWKVTGPVGRRAATAFVKAWATRSVRRWSAVAQPTTRREARSMTVARYSHPSQVLM
jgi:hypothetical protein